MQLQMNPGLGAGYKSRAQIARVVTEEWGLRNLYCPACDVTRLERCSPNTRAFDYDCAGCGAGFQLKSGAGWSETRIPDAAYEAMVAAIRSGRVPNLFVLQYTRDWRVLNLLLVPSFFFTESALQKRKPLTSGARRAGWVGCNILLSAIAPEGKLRLVAAGQARGSDLIRAQYRKIRPLGSLPISRRSWTLDILAFVHRLGRKRFALRDMYAFESNLARLYPQNRNIRAKIRQQLQVLRDLGLLDFLGNGDTQHDDIECS
jgi:type II restriction enzyme